MKQKIFKSIIKIWNSTIGHIIKVYRLGKKYHNMKEEKERKIKELERKKTILSNKLDEVEDKLTNVEKSYKEAKKAIEDFKDKGELPSPNSLKEHYMYKYEQSPWTYDAKGEGRMEVSRTLRYDNEEIIREYARETKERHDLTSDNTPDEIMTKLYEDSIREWDWDYETDKEHFGMIEYWQDADKSLKDMTGDCDDKAIAMYCVAELLFEMLGKGDNFWRLRFTAGRTLSGGHAFCVWLSDDLQWYVVESTMDAEGSYRRAWLEAAIKNQNFYSEFYGFATKYRTWRGDLDVMEPHEDAESPHYMEKKDT